MNIADRRLFAFKLPPLRADNGPAGGLPQALSGPHLGHGTRDDALMLIGVHFVVRRCFSAPQRPLRVSELSVPAGVDP